MIADLLWDLAGMEIAVPSPSNAKLRTMKGTDIQGTYIL